MLRESNLEKLSTRNSSTSTSSSSSVSSTLTTLTMAETARQSHGTSHTNPISKQNLSYSSASTAKLFRTAIILTIIFLTTVVSGRRYSPLIVEEPEGARRNSRPAVSECTFGKTLRELGSTWYADLGPPFGVMYCIKCECVAVPKKRRIVARVQCRNIKNECPPALCDDPVLLPGKCCKTCPGDKNESELANDVPAPVNLEETEERNMKHFAALLTGRTSYFLKGEEMKAMYTTYNPLNIVATGRFMFYKKNLYYSFYTSSKVSRPRAIQFVDDSGTILEEHQLDASLTGGISAYQNATGKICGVWRRVPRDYKRLLREDRLHVVLLWGSKQQAELALAGKIAKYAALQSELFSSLMEPAAVGGKSELMNGAGGTAIISTSSGAASSIHLTLVFNGVFSADEFMDVPINVRIELADRREIVLDEMQKVRKPSAEVNVLEISSPISIQNLRLMSRGKLQLTVESKKNPNLRLQGHIVTRTTCELFQTLLSPHNAELRSKSSGLAWFYLNTDGSLTYNIETDQISSRHHPQISLIEEQGKRKVLEDLTPTFNFNQAIGTIDKLGPKILESLYAGDLGINIAIDGDASLIRGLLVPRPVADARDSSEPILLKRADTSVAAPAHAMGMAWLAIDSECNLHYEITVNGFQSNTSDLQLYLEEKPIEAIGAPVTRKLLEEFSGSYLEGFLLGMPSNELVKLETSVCYLEVHSKKRKELLLRGKLKSTKVPAHCFPVYTDNNVPNVMLPGDHNDNHLIPADSKCFHSGRFYDEAEQWRSAQDVCQMCACQRGHASCESIKCPLVQCKQHERLLKREGECCSMCVSENVVLEIPDPAEQTKKGCQLGDQFYLAGSKWHPFLPPNGFDTCTTCSCDALTLEIRCPRVVCPPLQCSDKLAYRPDKKACCKVCPGKPSMSAEKTIATNPNVLQDQATHKSNARTTEEILSQGGCKALSKIYENGQEWHPVLVSHGEQKCIMCRCKDSKVTCDRKRCSRSVCQQTRVSSKRKVFEKSNMANEPLDECCSTQCRRPRRHHKRGQQLDRLSSANGDEKQLQQQSKRVHANANRGGSRSHSS